MPYAAEGRISQDHFDGSLEISQAQFLEGLEGMQNGLHVQIIDGTFFVGPLPEPEPEPTPEPTYTEALAALSADYQADIAALNSAFATATLMGGAAMDTKHNAIRAQFTARKNEYLADYAALRAKYGV